MFIASLPVYNSENYSPVKPLLDLRENTPATPSDLNTQIKALYNELDRKDEQVIFSIAETAYTIASFIQGKQLWQRNWYSSGRWELAPMPKNVDPNKVRSINTMQFQVSQMLEDIISSNPDFEPSDMFKSFEYSQAAKKSKAVINHYEPKIWTPYFNIMQGLDLITAGTAIEQLKYDAGAKSFEVFKEIWGESEMIVDEGGGECYGCGLKAKFDDFHMWENPKDEQDEKEANEDGKQSAMSGFPQCPQCGEFEVDVHEPQSEKVPTIVGREKYDVGDFVLLARSILSTRFDVSRRPEESSYFITKDYIPNSKVKRLIGDINLPGLSETDIGLEYLHKISRIGAGIGGAKREYVEQKASHKHAMLVTMSIDLDLCAEIQIPNTSDERMTLAGELPKGKTLADLPDVQRNGGATVLGLNGMGVIYGIYAKHHSKEVASIQYFSKPNSGTGRGAEDLAEMQKRRNRQDAQVVAAVDGASPGYVAVQGSMDESELKKMGFPNSRGFITQAAFNLAGRDIDKAIKQFPPQMVAPQLFEYGQEIERFTQMTAHNVSMSGAVFDADNKTATGANILRATAQEIAIPFLNSKAGGRTRTVRNLLGGYRDFFPDIKRNFSLGASSNRQFSQIEVAGRDIDPEIEFVIVANSEIPQNYYSRKVDYLGFTQVVGGIPIIEQLSQANPRLLNVYEKAFNIDLGMNGFDRIEEVCQLRMRQAFDLAELFGELLLQAQSRTQQGGPPQMAEGPEASPSSQIDNMMPQNQAQNGLMPEDENYAFDMLLDNIEPKILPKEKNHKAKSDWFCDYLDSEEGLKLSEIERRILVELSIRHDEMAQIAMVGTMANQTLTESAAGLPISAIEAKGAMIAQQAMPQEEAPGGKPAVKAKPKAKAA